METLFSDGCYSPAVGTAFDLNGGAAFAAGTRLKAQVISGAGNQVTAPALHVTGAYPTWTLSFDDGVGGVGEPDHNDLIITVTANPVPVARDDGSSAGERRRTQVFDGLDSPRHSTGTGGPARALGRVAGPPRPAG